MRYQEILGELVLKSGLSHREISRRAEERGTKVSQAYISQLIKGVVPPPSEEVTRVLAEVLNGDADSLIMAAYYDKAPEQIKEKLDKIDDINTFLTENLITLTLFNDMLANKPEQLPPGLRERLSISDETIKKFPKNGTELAYYIDALSINDKIHTLNMFLHDATNNNVAPDEYVELLRTPNFKGKRTGQTFTKQNGKLRMHDKEGNVITETLIHRPTLVRVPLLGTIRAGQPIDRIENIESEMLIDSERIKGREAFALRVQGDSMSGDRIQEGDIVIVVKQEEVQPHEIAVVAINEDYATLKRVKPAGDMCMLIPSNPTMSPELVPCKDVKIIGKVVEVKFFLD
ncbi:LexA family transcriptional regulator [Paenibacillus odorifer]|uniref:LexA family transcriptional regulator n=1 Tax=Paenibacillus odorifer TaxID=189426 RepID=UPI00096D93FC|nr:LexA family transcriptional regulator [Paenibacillus odorifer]OME23385.1 hypothetical protein BSK57_16360 [Paenibacillus odorifer]